jgi:hypothetical protein
VKVARHASANTPSLWTSLRLVALASLVLVALPARADNEACLSAHEKAQIERMHGRYVEAHAQLLACAQASCPGGIRNDCKGWLNEVEASLPTLVFAVSDASGRDLVDVRISADGKLLDERANGRSLTLNPGLYTLRFEATGYVTQEQQVLVREAEKQRIIRVSLQPMGASLAPASGLGDASAATHASGPDPRQRRLLLTSYVLGGAAVAALAVGIGFGVSGKKKYDELKAEGCEPDCPPGEVESGKRRYVIADVAFAAAGAFAVTSVVTLVLGLRKGRPDRPPPAQVAIGPRAASLTWNTVF